MTATKKVERWELCAKPPMSPPEQFAGVGALAFRALEGLPQAALDEAMAGIAAAGPGVYSRNSRDGRNFSDNLISVHQAVFSLETPRMHEAWIRRQASALELSQALAMALKYSRTACVSRLLATTQHLAPIGSLDQVENDIIHAALPYYRPAEAGDLEQVWAGIARLWPGKLTREASQRALRHAIRQDNLEVACWMRQAFSPGFSDREVFRNALKYGAQSVSQDVLANSAELRQELDNEAFADIFTRAFVERIEKSSEAGGGANELTKAAGLVLQTCAALSLDFRRQVAAKLQRTLDSGPALDEDEDFFSLQDDDAVPGNPWPATTQAALEAVLLELQTPSPSNRSRPALRL